MKILMMTNTFTPHIGGVARSVEAFTREYRKAGHHVLVVAPVFERDPEQETNVIRIPAIQNFNGSDFSVRLPIPPFLFSALDRFQPDIVHAHHPFLLGDTALRVAALRNVPLVFTHHTMYERYTHYVPGDSAALRRFVIELSTGYANLCDAVVTPSESVEAILRQRGVRSPIQVIPTGVEAERFARGDGAKVRSAFGITPVDFVIGHVGRLAPEKNLNFLGEAVSNFLMENDQAHFLIVGSGPSEGNLKDLFERTQTDSHVHFTGMLDSPELENAYHAMDVFVFASQSETQGMVLAEAMAAGVPVVAIDAPGVREVVMDGCNGCLLSSERLETFSSALKWVASLSEPLRRKIIKAAGETGDRFSLSRSVTRTLDLYQFLMGKGHGQRHAEETMWSSALDLIEAEWELWVNRLHAARAALIGGRPE